MTTKSDFAQKLISDLRLRKERMAAAQNSSRQSRVVHGNSDRTSRGARINGLESAGSRSGNTSRRSNGSSRSVNITDSSNQIVLYESGQSSRQVRDLSMAIAFAFENSGNLTKIGASTSNPLVNFFNQFGRRSLDRHKMDTTSFNNHSQLPSISNIHITEISKGVQKLNQILRACSNGLNLDRNSIEVGKQLLKGAVDLEESLRMLANFQEGSKYATGTQKKSRLKLLEEDEDDQDAKTADEWKLDRPRFSFDKTSRNSNVVQGGTIRQQLALSYTDENSEHSRMVLHRRSSSYVQDLSLSTEGKLSNNSSSSLSTQEKGRLSNVIAKLMGLEELPLRDDSACMQNDTEGKQGKVSRKNTRLPEPLDKQSKNGSPVSNDKKPIVTNKTPPIRDSKIQLRAEKNQESPDRSSKMANSERNQLRKDLNMLVVATEEVPRPKVATNVMNKQQGHAVVPNQVKGFLTFEDNERKQNLMDNKESKLQQKAHGKILKTEDKTHNKIEHKTSENSREKRTADKDIPSNRQKPQDQSVLLQEQVLERTARSEEKRRPEQKGQQLQKQNLIAKNHEGHQVEPEPVIGTKSKRNTAMNSQKKLSRDKNAPGKGRSTRQTEKVPTKDAPTGSHQDVGPVSKVSPKTAPNQESLKKEEPNHNLPPREPQFDTEKESSNPVLTREKPIEGSTTQKKVTPRKVKKGEIPRKMDVLITRRNATVNHSTRSIKQPANMLRDLKQQMHSKNWSSKRMEEQSDSNVKEGKAGIRMNHESEMSTEPVWQQDKLQSKADQNITLNSSLNDNCDAIALNFGEVSDDLQSAERPCALMDEQELKQCDRDIEDHEESTKLHNLSQQEHKKSPPLVRHKQLTEPEKDLKEIVIKSQLFLSTSEALFKLNIPVSFLHVGDPDDEGTEKKLVLDCAYEVMKRKARRHEVTYHPYTKTTISCTKVRSLDDLVKQLCKDLEMLKFYGENQSDVATGLHKMLHKDIYNTYPDVNSVWDFEWSKMTSVLPEKEDVIRDVEKQVLNGLLEEITNDLLVITVSV